LACLGDLVGGFGEHTSLVRSAVIAYAGRIADFREDPDPNVRAAAGDVLSRIS
jgi:hypothetical protein